MSGHSKWATIKHKKGAADKKRGKLFAKLIRQVEIAARSGGGDLEANPTLRTMFQKAREASVPIDTIERAIKRGTGEMEGVTYEEVTYEGYAPHGIAIYIEASTDNRNRTGAEVRSAFSKNGGSLAEPGAVAWQFARMGIVLVDGTLDEDDVMLAAAEAGAEDVVHNGDAWQVNCEPAELNTVRSALEAGGVAVSSSDLTMLPTSTIELTSAADAREVLHLIDVLEDNDDVQDVYANFDLSDEVLAELSY